MSEKLLVAYWGKRHASYNYVNNIVMHVNSKETRYNTVRMGLNFRGTKLSRIADSHYIRGFYFRG